MVKKRNIACLSFSCCSIGKSFISSSISSRSLIMGWPFSDHSSCKSHTSLSIYLFWDLSCPFSYQSSCKPCNTLLAYLCWDLSWPLSYQASCKHSNPPLVWLNLCLSWPFCLFWSFWPFWQLSFTYHSSHTPAGIPLLIIVLVLRLPLSYHSSIGPSTIPLL